MKFFKLEEWRGQEPVREEIAPEEAANLIEAILSGHRYTQYRPTFDGEVSVQVPLTWNDLYSDWLYRERGSWASWEGPQCSYGYFTAYVRPDAGHKREAIPGRFRTIRHMPLEVSDV